jgi:hypothetical protein
MYCRPKVLILMLLSLLATSTIFAEELAVRKDTKAMEVLKNMAAYRASLDHFMIKGVSHTDARLSGGLMVSNSTEVKVSLDRPGSLHISSFDGIDSREIYFQNGTLTVFGSEKNYYAQVSVPEDIEEALEFALEEMDIEAPLLDMLYQDVSTQLIRSQDTILYLTDKARIAGTDCHQIAIRGDEVDVQIWVEEGDRPLPRKIMITSKWAGGAPRFTSNLMWETEPEFAEGTFEFKAPEGSSEIGFVQDPSEGGE